MPEKITIEFVVEQNKKILFAQVASFLTTDFEKRGQPKNHFFHNRKIIGNAFFQLRAMVSLNEKREIVGYLIWRSVSDLMVEVDIIETIEAYRGKGIATKMLNALTEKLDSIYTLTASVLPQSRSFFQKVGWQGSLEASRFFKITRPCVAYSKELQDGCVIAVCPEDFYEVEKNPEKYKAAIQYFQISFERPGVLTKPIIAPFKYEGYIAIYFNRKLITSGKAKNLFLNGRQLGVSDLLAIKTFMPLHPELFIGTGFAIEQNAKTRTTVGTSIGGLFNTTMPQRRQRTDDSDETEVTHFQAK